MEIKILKANLRKEKGKGPARRLRSNGQIPSVIYGHREPVAIAIDEHEFRSHFKTISESTIIQLKTGDNTYDVLVKDFQEDFLKNKIMHIDFFEIEKGKVLKTHVPLHFTGSAIGIREGGIFEALVHGLEIECLPKDLPQEISVDISALGLGQSIHIAELPEIKGVRFLSSRDQVVCTVAKRGSEIAAPEVVEEAVATEEIQTPTEEK